jgi:hypothetical protein
VAEVPQEAVQAVERYLREHMRIRLGKGAIRDAMQDRPIRLSGGEAEYAARLAVDALAGAGLIVTGVCACGQPLGTCPGCGDPRCWRCDPESDDCHAEDQHAHYRMLTSMPCEHAGELERLRDALAEAERRGDFFAEKCADFQVRAEKAEAARRMLDASRKELGRERVEHGRLVAVLARVRALGEEWAAAGEDPVEPSDEVVAECGRELLGVVGPDAEGLGS